MTKPDCDICGGRGTVILAVQQRMRVVDVAPPSDAITMSRTHRSYPCPECSTVVPESHVAMVQCHALVDSHITDPAFTRHARADAAHRLVDFLLQRGLIEFRHGPVEGREQRYRLQATLGVVSPAHVASMEERIAQRQDEVAREVVAEAQRSIAVWGSHYTGNEGPISKAQAIDSVRHAITGVLAKRASWKREQNR